MTTDEFVDRLMEDNEQLTITDDDVLGILDELETAEFITRSTNTEDNVIFQARAGLKPSDFYMIDNPIKKNMLLYLVENPKTIFILQNTQSGKTVIVAKEISEWSRENKNVAFFITQNDKTLADQSAESLSTKCSVKTFMLSSNSKTTLDDVKTYIDAYATDMYNDYKMPLICVLANKTQNEKVMKLLDHIRNRCRRGSLLRYGIIFDEADETYPALRDQTFIGLSYRSFIVDDDAALHKLVFVSATEGDLMDSEYPECQNAYVHTVQPDAASRPFYRAAHHPDSIVKFNKMPKKMSSNQYAKKIVEEHQDYFFRADMYRKTIVHSNARAADMTRLANELVQMGAYAMVFNMHGVKVHRPGQSPYRLTTKGRSFNQLLFYLYKKLELHTKPLFILGRRKVDRGIGFHYAPRGNGQQVLPDWGLGELATDGIEGLIWTDEILGRIEDKNTAVQKAGRLAGIISQCPQYHSCTYWTDEYTWNMIVKHNKMVDQVNTTPGVQCMIQGTSHAIQSQEGCSGTGVGTGENGVGTGENGVGTGSGTRTANKEDDFNVEWHEFNSFEEVKRMATRVHHPKTHETQSAFMICSTDKKPTIQSYEAVMKMKEGKKTAGMDAGKCTTRGDHKDRLFVAYHDMADPSSVVFIVKRIIRK